ncbi:MAG TPA: CPBP family glutamic-type intramembrane protease [Anaerolineales bacterium]|nr:CPBP family glutamic-type intramembrane protease [Anaerolineales bacterium]
MKWFTPILPYLAVGIGLLWIHNAFLALLSFHAAIVLSLLVARSPIPIRVLFQSKKIRWVVLNILLCGSSGISLYFLWSYFGVIDDLPGQVEALGLTRSTWPLFITYFVLVNPLIEEYFWRGYLGSPTRGLYPSDFLYAGFHGLILMNKVQPGLILYSLGVLVLAGWFWRQLARADNGLLAPVLGHMAADFTILMAVYQKSVSL